MYTIEGFVFENNNTEELVVVGKEVIFIPDGTWANEYAERTDTTMVNAVLVISNK